jgi:hypothetical protein
MGEVINFRRARKARERAQDAQTAAEQRRRFGRTKAEKNKEAAEREQAERTIAAHQRDKDEDPE